jgi:hypothetical protein
MDEAKSLVKRMTSPVTITTFTTTNADPNYKSGVIVKNTNLMAGKYKATKQLVPTASANLRADQYLEPKDNPPVLQTPAVDQNVVEVTNVIKELIGRGYFTREVSVMNPGSKKYNGLDLILRNAEKIEQFIGFSTNPPAQRQQPSGYDFNDTSWTDDFGDAY